MKLWVSCKNLVMILSNFEKSFIIKVSCYLQKLHQTNTREFENLKNYKKIDYTDGITYFNTIFWVIFFNSTGSFKLIIKFQESL